RRSGRAVSASHTSIAERIPACRAGYPESITRPSRERDATNTTILAVDLGKHNCALSWVELQRRVRHLSRTTPRPDSLGQGSSPTGRGAGEEGPCQPSREDEQAAPPKEPRRGRSVAFEQSTDRVRIHNTEE